RFAVPQDVAFGHFVAVAACQHIGERRLARTVRTHDGVYLALRNFVRQPLEDHPILIRELHVQIFYFKHFPKPSHLSFRYSPHVRGERNSQPTLPSSEIPISFCVSAMNSIGRGCSTSRAASLHRPDATAS